MALDEGTRGDRPRARRKKKVVARRTSPQPSPDVRDRLEAGRSVVPTLSSGGRIAERTVSPPKITTPDTADRARDTRIGNLTRGASASGGPGARAIREAERLARGMRAGRTNASDVQFHLRKNGYNIAIDGQWGPQTEQAWQQFITALTYVGQEREAQQKQVMIRGVTQPDREMERAALGGGAFSYGVGRDKVLAEEKKRAEIQESMEKFLREEEAKRERENSKQNFADRWGLIGATKRAGNYLSEELAAPAIGSTQGFFDTVVAMGTAGSLHPEAVYEKKLENAQRAQMGYADAQFLKGAAGLADRFVQDVYQSTVGAPAGIAYFVANPIEAAKMTWEDYKHRYGPLVGGDLDTFLERQGEHPLFAVLDVAGAANVLAKGAQIAGLVKRRNKMLRELKVGEGYVQLYQPGSALGQVLAAKMDAFSEKHPDLAFIGANQRGANALRNSSDRKLDEIRATTVGFQRASRKLNAPERMAYDVLARYGPDVASKFLELEINKRWAASNDKGVPRAIRTAQRAQHRALRESATQVQNPSVKLMRALTLGRELTEGRKGPDGPGPLSTEGMKFELQMLDPETAASRKDLTAQIFGDMPEVGEVQSRTNLYAHFRELYPEHVATAFMHMTDSGALHGAREMGGTPEAWYAKHVSEARADVNADPRNPPANVLLQKAEGPAARPSRAAALHAEADALIAESDRLLAELEAHPASRSSVGRSYADNAKIQSLHKDSARARQKGNELRREAERVGRKESTLAALRGGSDAPAQESLFDPGVPVEKVRPVSAVTLETLQARHGADIPDIDVEGIAGEVLASGMKLPPELQVPGALVARMNEVMALARAGADGKEWYDIAADISNDIAKNYEPAVRLGLTPSQVAQLIAIFSQASSTLVNMSFVREAIRQYADWNVTHSGRFPTRQSPEADAVMRGEPWEGRKRSSFYANIIEKLDPKEYAALGFDKHPVTVDRWVTRWFIPDKDVPGQYYDAFEGILQRMAEQMGWQPKQLQAAAWVTTKKLDLAKRNPKWSAHQVDAAGKDAYELGHTRYFGQSELDLKNKIISPWAKKAATAAQKPDGGGTLRKDLKPDRATAGYMVSYGAHEQISGVPIEAQVIQSYRDLHRGLLDEDRAHRVGIWHGTEETNAKGKPISNGGVYLDISKRFSTRKEAFAFAREQGQLSFYDVRAGKSIPTGLTRAQANEIKNRLKDEYYGESKPMPVRKNMTLTLTPYEELLEGMARELYPKGKISQARRRETEDFFLNNDFAKTYPIYEEWSRAYDKAHPLQGPDEGIPFGDVLHQAADDPPLRGLPPKGSPSPEVREIATAFKQADTEEPTDYAPADPEGGAQVGEWYDKAEHAPDDPEVIAGYDALKRESIEQGEALLAAGYTVDFYPEGVDPYPGGPWEAMADMRDNKHLYVFPTEGGFGSGATTLRHPLLELVPGVEWGGRRVTYNDWFRWIHDAYGHHKEGVGFRADGEFNAFRQHVAMFSPLARRAMASETHGQNSWVNYGPHGEKNRTANQAETVYADQKAVLAPEWVVRMGEAEPDWVIPEDVDAWVRAGQKGEDDAPDFDADAEDISFEEPGDFKPVVPNPVDPTPYLQMPKVRRLRDESDADYAARVKWFEDDFNRQAGEALGRNDKNADTFPEDFARNLRDDVGKRAQDEASRVAGMGHIYGEGDTITTKSGRTFKILGRRVSKGEPAYRVEQIGGDNPGASYDLPESAIDNFADRPDWLPQEIGPDRSANRGGGWKLNQPSAAQYTIEDASASGRGRVSVRYTPASGKKMSRVYFESRKEADRFVEDQVKRRKYLLEKHPDFAYQQTRGKLRGVAAYAGGKMAIGLDPQDANFSTPIHEAGGHLIRRFLPPSSLRRFEQNLGVKDGVWTVKHEENFAKLVEKYFWRGEAPNWQLRSHFAIMREGMRKVYGDNPPRPEGIDKWQTQRLYGLLDEVFNRTLALKAGDGSFYMPDVASWRARGATSGRRKSLRQQKTKQQKNRGVLQGQGRLQRGPKVTMLEFNRTARLYENHMSIKELDGFASAIDLDGHPETGGVPPGYGLFNPKGVEVPRVFREVPTSDDLFGRFPHEMAREMQQQRDSLLAHSFPDDMKMVPKEYRENIKVLPTQIIEAFTGDKVSIRMARSPRVDKLIAAVDISNAVFKAALIYGKLSYIPLNFAGNMVFLTLAAGPFAGPALVRAARGIGGLDPEILAKIDFFVGEGAAAALALEERNALVRGINHLAYAQSAVADRLPRRAAWVYYAGKAGFVSDGSISKLLDGGDEVWRDGVTFKQARFQISEAAERSMVQFRGMSPFQQDVISRAVFIYGWLRGATKYGLHSSIERPIRTNLMLQQGQEQWEEMEEKFGKLVSYLDGITPVGKMEEMLGVETVPVRGTQAVNPVSTAGEALAAIYNTAKGDTKIAGPKALDYLSPALKTPLEAITGISFFTGEEYGNRWEAVYGQPLRWPAIKIGRQLISPDVTAPDIADRPVERQPNYIVPSKEAGRREALEELLLGSARKRNLNPRAAEARGREERGEAKAYGDYREDLIDKFKDAGMGAPSDIVLSELRAQVKLDADPRLDKGSSYRDKLKATAEINRDPGMAELADGMTEAAAESYYFKLRNAMFLNLNKWERQADKIIDAELEKP